MQSKRGDNMQNSSAAEFATNLPETEQRAVTLTAYAKRVKIQGKWFSGSDVSLDGYEFERCRFDKCSLISSNGDFIMKDCFIADNNSVTVGDGAQRIVTLALYRLSMHIPILQQIRKPPVSPIFNPDGTISIGI